MAHLIATKRHKRYERYAGSIWISLGPEIAISRKGGGGNYDRGMAEKCDGIKMAGSKKVVLEH